MFEFLQLLFKSLPQAFSRKVRKSESIQIIFGLRIVFRSIEIVNKVAKQGCLHIIWNENIGQKEN